MTVTRSASSDGALVASAAAGDRAAFTELYERHVDTVHDHLVRWCRDGALAADATQEAFMTLLTKLDTIRDGQAVLAWLLRTARNRAIDELRRTGRERTEAAMRDGDSPGVVMTAADDDRAADPQRAAEATDAADWVWEVAAGLDDRTFSVLDLTVRQGLTGPELATVLDTTPGNANVLVHRMRARVGALFAGVAFLRAVGDCEPLAAIESTLADPLDLPGARRLEEHAAQCGACAPRRRRAIAPLRAYAAFADVAAPPAVRDGVERAIDDHFGPGPGGSDGRTGTGWGHRGSRAATRIAVIAAVVLAATTAVATPVADPTDDEVRAVDATVSASPAPAPSESASTEDTEAPSREGPTATAEASESAVPQPSDDEVPSEEPVDDPDVPEPVEPDPDEPDEPADPDEPVEPDQPEEPVEPEPPTVVTIAIARPVDGLVVDASVGPTTRRVAVEATWTADRPVDVSITWRSDRLGGVLLDAATGVVELPVPPACSSVRHTLTATAAAADGGTASDAVGVLVRADCPPIDVRIDAPVDGTVVSIDDRGPPPTATVRAASTIADGGALQYVWTSDRAGVLLRERTGTLRLTADGCGVTQHLVTLTVTDPATGRTGSDAVQVGVGLPC